MYDDRRSEEATPDVVTWSSLLLEPGTIFLILSVLTAIALPIWLRLH